MGVDLTAIANARQILGEGYELANNANLEYDKLTILKQAYLLATNHVKDQLKRPNGRLFFKNIDDYQSKIHEKRKHNLFAINPDPVLEKKLLGYEDAFNKYRRALLIKDSEYQDDIIILNKDNVPQYLTLDELDEYIQVYKVWLDKVYKANRKI